MDSYRQSVATNIGLRLNPFQQREAFGKSVASGVRVASVFSGHGTSLGLTDSTNGSPRNGYKTFSKWEKQDLEAKAMMKMREANMKKQAEKEEREAKEKAEKQKREKEAADAAAAAAAAKSVPTITITTPAEVKPSQTEAKPPAFLFAPSSTSSESTKDAASKQTSFFGPPSGASASSFTLGNAPPLKSEDKPPAQPATTQPLTSGPSFFTNPSSGLPAKPTPPLFSSASTDNKSQQTKAQTAFSFPAPAKPANVPTAGNRSAFTLGPSPSQISGQKDGQVTSGATGGSLLSRVASSTHSAAQPQQPTSAFTLNSKPAASQAQSTPSVSGNTATQANPPSAPAPVVTSTGATTKPKFDFGISNKPTSSVPAPPSSISSLSGALGNNAGKPASTPLSFNFKTPAVPAGGASSTSGPSTAPKFSFAATSSGTAASGTNLFGGSKAPAPATAPQSTEAQTKTHATSFTPVSGATPFGGNKDSAVTSTTPQFGVTVSPFGGATNSSSTSPFGTLGGSVASASAGSQLTQQNKPSVFSTNPSSASPFGSFGGDKAPQSNDTAVKSPFSGFGNGTQGASPSPFGSNTGSGAGSTAFGASGTSNASGNNGAAETPKTTFAWTTTPSSTPTANTAEAPKSIFSFGSQTTTTPASTPPTNGAPSSFSAFKFGDASTTTTNSQAPQPATGQSIFGGMPTATTPSAFGFGTPAATGASGSSNPFGNPPPSTQ
jgi:hypothetical protein